jgi:two-component system sensor kinase FixL
MSWTTFVWSMNAGICLTLAGVHLLVWLRARDSWTTLAFAVSAAAAAVTAVFELDLMHAQTTVQYGQVLRWIQIPVAVIVVSLIWFIRLYLRAGRPWLAWSICGLQVLVVIVTFASVPNINFREITALRQVPMWGEMAAVPFGVMSWRILAGP